MLKRHKMWVVGALGLISICSFFYWYFFLYGKVSTDNAYVMADSATISSRVPGNIKAVFVENDSLVKEGDLIVELDPTDYELQLKQAQAGVERIRAEIRAMEIEIQLTEKTTQSGYEAAKAGMAQALEQKKRLEEILGQLKENRRVSEAELELASKEHIRISNLYKDGVVPKRSKDQVDKAYSQAKAQLASVDAEIEAARKGIMAAQKEVERQEAMVAKALSELRSVQLKKERLLGLIAQEKELVARYELAKQNLSYCKIQAPIAGYVAQKRIQVGERVNPGQALMAIVPLEQVYVEANFKETQIEKIRSGQEVLIKPDMYPKVTLKGKVAGVRAGTGAAFSLLPPENATGNWIKVVQRVPVRIELVGGNPTETPLRVGSSVYVTVLVRNQK